MRVHITGASGSGTSTLGQMLATRMGARHADADNFYWLPTTPPFTQKRPPAQRHDMLLATLSASPTVVLSGSIMGWGQDLEDFFDLVVFLYVPADIRVERLRQREMARYGVADPAFLAWAAAYDEGPSEGRSLRKHETWLAARSCPVLRLVGDLSTGERTRRVMAAAVAHRTLEIAAPGGREDPPA